VLTVVGSSAFAPQTPACCLPSGLASRSSSASEKLRDGLDLFREFRSRNDSVSQIKRGILPLKLSLNILFGDPDAGGHKRFQLLARYVFCHAALECGYIAHTLFVLGHVELA